MKSVLITLFMCSALLLGAASAQEDPSAAATPGELSAVTGEGVEQRMIADLRSPSTRGKEASQSTRLSEPFTFAALAVTFRMQSSERRIEQSIRRGFPLGEFWIQNDMESIDDAIRVASLSVTNMADMEALQRLQAESARLRSWTSWLIEENRNLRLAEYYISGSALDNDEEFQSNLACTQFLSTMLTSRQLTEGGACR